MRKEFLFILLLASISLAAPAMVLPAYNPETKECGYYWAGDEFTSYSLPKGWILGNHTYENNELIYSIEAESKTGYCNYSNFEECCNGIGYSYIGDVNKKTSFDFLIPSLVIIVVILAAIIIYLKRKK